ncbi:MULTISPECIES: ABC transporter permease [Azospirillaceae]|uniref:ABC transporter permease n=1 Tax=Niveispirillum sp. BGYR6 TaxID=2971249 RepID=UPI000B682719|nr:MULTISPECIES: ABC transporter permease [Azospirillaceae]MDG5496527.1 ABC transporter permease [Niveispirillum sp. BGYR6]SNS70711.1 ABC-2 type transport system permease protein [Azospirillum sp. RU38E]SNS88963.1 ABC-2 type transport system permease protein [Azospirillum sp. RU37A]
MGHIQRWFLTVYYLGVKELSSVLADKVLLAFIIYCFSVSVYTVATGVKTDVAGARVAVVDADGSALSRRIRDALLPPQFKTPELIDRSQVDRVMDEGRYAFVLDLPPRLEADLREGHQPTIQLNIDATAMTMAGLGSAYIQTIINQEVAEALSPDAPNRAPVSVVTRTYFNPNLEGMWFQAVMAVIQYITIMSILLVGAAVIREREHGTIEHLLVMPLGASEIAAAKIWANGLVILVATGLSLQFVVRLWLGVPIEGSIPLFLACVALYLFATMSLGILLATVTRSMPQFSLVGIPVFLVLNMLSGATSPLESMPTVLQWLVQVSPTMHFVQLAQAILYRGAGLAIIWPQLLVLAGLGAGFLAVALPQFRAMLARSQ